MLITFKPFSYLPVQTSEIKTASNDNAKYLDYLAYESVNFSLLIGIFCNVLTKHLWLSIRNPRVFGQLWRNRRLKARLNKIRVKNRGVSLFRAPTTINPLSWSLYSAFPFNNRNYSLNIIILWFNSLNLIRIREKNFKVCFKQNRWTHENVLKNKIKNYHPFYFYSL